MSFNWLKTPLAFTRCCRNGQSKLKEYLQVGKSGEVTSSQSIHLFNTAKKVEFPDFAFEGNST